MIGFPGGRALQRAHQWLHRRVHGDDGGFILLESIVAISLITIIMGAIGAEYVNGLASTSRQRATQVATEVAGSTMDQIRALNPTDLVTGRDANSVSTQFAAGNAIATVQPWLQSMDQVSDPNAANGAGSTAIIPTAATVQKPGVISYTVMQYLGTCRLASFGSSSNCVPLAQVPSGQTTSAVQYQRVVVAVSWTASTCGANPCYYVTSTLISGTTDPLFRVNQALPPLPMVTSPGAQVNELGDTVSLQLAVQSGTGVPSFTWDISAGALPAGLSLSPSGLITGTPTSATGTQSVTVRATDAYGRKGTSTFTWGVFAQPTITAPPNQVTPINTAVTLALTTSCQNSPCTYSFSNGPTGLSINSSGVITGTPTVAGTSTGTVTVTDASNVSRTTAPFTWTVVPPVATCNPAVSLTNGSFEAPGGVSGAGANIGNGTSGLGWRTNDANGQIEFWGNGSNSQSQNGGTPITAQDGTQWAEVNGAGMDTLSQDLATTPGQVLQWSLWHRARNATGNVAATDTIQVQMGSTSSQTPQIASSNTNAAISDGAATWVNYTGTYTVPAGQTTTRFQVAATATSSGSIGVGNFLDNVTVTGTACMAALPTTQTNTVNAPITAVQLNASQGSGSYTWSGGSSLPAGLSLTTGGLITGTPTTVGATPVTLTLTDAKSGYQQSVAFNWVVKSPPSVTTPLNQSSTVGAAVNLAVTASCPNAPCSYSLSGQPAGLGISSSTGTITGTPTTAGSSTAVRVTIADSQGVTSSSSTFTWNVYTTPTVNSPGTRTNTAGTALSLPISSSCPNYPCSFSISGQPTGLTINSGSGTISGTPTGSGTFGSVRVSITDYAGATTSTATFSWTIYAAATMTSPGTQATTVNSSVITPIPSSCPNSPCTFAATGLPGGLSINSSTGTITGTPTATAAASTTRVTLTDNSGATTTVTFSWTVYAAPSITAPSNQSTVNNAAVNLALTSSCPNSACAYRLNGGPAGLSISSTGLVTGTVTSPQSTFSGVTITVTDNSGVTATSAAFTWSVTTPLVGRWTYDEASGSTAADSAGSHPATLSGNYGKTSVDVQGANAVTMDGSSGTYATTSGPVLNTANSFTVSAWAKLASTSGYSTFVSQSGTNVGGFYLQYNPNTNRFRFYKLSSDSTSSAGAAQSSVAAPVIGQWYQLTGVYDATAGTISLFVNGVRQGTAVAAPGGFNATGNFTMGAGNFGGLTNWTNGAIDDVRAYSSALSDAAVTQLAQAAYWRLDEGTGTAAGDSSLNGANATLSGGTSWTPGIVGPSAVQFNGSSGVITSSSNPIDTSQSFSVSAWAKADSLNSTGVVVSADGNTISSFLLRQNNDRWAMLGVLSDSGSTTITTTTSTSSLVVGQWYHLIGVYDSVAKTLSLYVNGVLQGSPVSVTGNFKASGALVIGRSLYQTNQNYFGGAIDDVRAFRFPVDQAGVNILATLTPPSPATPTASAGTTSATVSWTAPVNVGGSPVTGYVVTPLLNGVAQTAVTYNSTATTQTLTGLTTGASYTFTVAAVNANGTSAPSAPSTAVQPS